MLFFSKNNPQINFDARFDVILENFVRLYKVTTLLNNQESKDLFIRLIQMHFFTSFLDDKTLIDLECIFSKKEWLSFNEQIKEMEYTSLKGVCDADLIETWVLEGYTLKGICEASHGDVVVDGGAHTGNTAIYFSKKIGDSGHVLSFEPSPLTFRYLRENISDWNMGNVSLIESALSNVNGQMNISNIDDTSASLIYGTKSTIPVDVIMLDDYCLANNIAPDFIKLDVKGAEADALNGARAIIQKYHPKMAISIYNRDDDFFVLPDLILEINPYYEFYIKHSSNVHFETVLFCKPVDYKNKIFDSSDENLRSILILRDTLLELKKTLILQSKDAIIAKQDAIIAKNKLIVLPFMIKRASMVKKYIKKKLKI